MIGQFAHYLEQMGAERDWEKSSFVTCFSRWHLCVHGAHHSWRFSSSLHVSFSEHLPWLVCFHNIWNVWGVHFSGIPGKLDGGLNIFGVWDVEIGSAESQGDCQWDVKTSVQYLCSGASPTIFCEIKNKRNLNTVMAQLHQEAKHIGLFIWPRSKLCKQPLC